MTTLSSAAPQLKRDPLGGSMGVRSTRISTWSDPPPMDIGAPQPNFERAGDVAWLAYRTDRGDHFAILRFDGVLELLFGDPNDEALETHRLFAAGLQSYKFQEVHDEPGLEHGLRRWIITFHDDTFEVTARSAAVLVRAVEAPSAIHALAAART